MSKSFVLYGYAYRDVSQQLFMMTGALGSLSMYASSFSDVVVATRILDTRRPKHKKTLDGILILLCQQHLSHIPKTVFYQATLDHFRLYRAPNKHENPGHQFCAELLQANHNGHASSNFAGSHGYLYCAKTFETHLRPDVLPTAFER